MLTTVLCLLGEGGCPESNSDCKTVVVQTAETVHPGQCITGKMWVEIGLMKTVSKTVFSIA